MTICSPGLIAAPRRNRRLVFDVEVFEDAVPSGFRVTYIVNDAVPYVAVLRVRKL